MSRYYNDILQHSDDELMHYGVKGMKWKIRKARSKIGNAIDRSALRDEHNSKMWRSSANNIRNNKYMTYYVHGRGVLKGAERQAHVEKQAAKQDKTANRLSRIAGIKRKLAKFIRGTNKPKR